MKTRQCPACHGYGGYTEPVIDFEQGPWEPCGYCNSKGTIRGRRFFRVLGWLSGLKRQRNANKKNLT